MKRFLAGLFLAVVSISLHAQTIYLRATIPFAFHAGGKWMPAGEYTVQAQNHTLIMQDRAENQAVQLIAQSASRVRARSQPIVEFHRYGEKYFLSSVWTNGSYEGLAVPTSRAEKEIAGSLGRQEPVSIALQRQ